MSASEDRLRRGESSRRSLELDGPLPWHGCCTPEEAHFSKEGVLSKVLRGVVAGWGAKKSGCGCIGTVIIFFILWSLLGSFKIFQ